MPTLEKRWETIDKQITFHQTQTREAFKFFVKIATAVAGGSAWLSVQPGLGAKGHKLALVADGLLCFSAVLTAFIIYEHHRAWRGWRSAQSSLAGNHEDGTLILKPSVASIRASRGGDGRCVCCVRNCVRGL